MSRLETDEELQSRLLRTYPTGYSESGIRELCTGRALDDLAKWHGTKRMTVPEQEEGMKRTDNGMRWWEERERMGVSVAFAGARDCLCSRETKTVQVLSRVRQSALLE